MNMIPQDVYKNIMSFMNIHDKLQFARASRCVSEAHGSTPIEFVYFLYAMQESIQLQYTNELYKLCEELLAYKEDHRVCNFSYDKIKELVYEGADVNETVSFRPPVIYQNISLLSFLMIQDNVDDTFRHLVVDKINVPKHIDHVMEHYVFFTNSDMRMQSTKLLSLLLKRGLNPSHCLKDGSSLLEQMFHKEHMDMAKMLIQAGANIDYVNREGKTICMELIKICGFARYSPRKCKEVLEMVLIKQPKTLNKPCKMFRVETPLDFSTRFNDYELTELLYSYGAKHAFDVQIEKTQKQMSFMLGGIGILSAAFLTYRYWKARHH
jgi:hypothetical protein